MIEQLKNGIIEINKFVYMFADRQQLQLDKLVMDDAHFQVGNEPHILEMHYNGKCAFVNLSTDDILSFSIDTKHKLMMGLMNFVE